MKPIESFEPIDLINVRKQLKLTQKQCAEMVYKNIRTWQKWEGGERPIDLASLELFLIKAGLLNAKYYIT